MWGLNIRGRQGLIFAHFKSILFIYFVPRWRRLTTHVTFFVRARNNNYYERTYFRRVFSQIDFFGFELTFSIFSFRLGAVSIFLAARGAAWQFGLVSFGGSELFERGAPLWSLRALCGVRCDATAFSGIICTVGLTRGTLRNAIFREFWPSRIRPFSSDATPRDTAKGRNDADESLQDKLKKYIKKYYVNMILIMTKSKFMLFIFLKSTNYLDG